MTVELDSWVSEYVVGLKPALRAAIGRLVLDVDPDDVAGLGVYTDADARSIVAAAQTRAHWAQLGDARPELRDFYRWSIGEWERTTVGVIDAGGPDDLAAVTAEAERVADEVVAGRAGGDDLETFRYIVWEGIVTALGQLFDEGFFDPWPAAVQLFGVPETEIEPATLTDWMAEINTDDAAAEYARWLSAQYG